jgi:hypothetical protein
MIAIMDEVGVRQSQLEIDITGNTPVYRTVKPIEHVARISPPAGMVFPTPGNQIDP